jgi:hypothetical protein
MYSSAESGACWLSSTTAAAMPMNARTINIGPRRIPVGFGAVSAGPSSSVALSAGLSPAVAPARAPFGAVTLAPADTGAGALGKDG